MFLENTPKQQGGVMLLEALIAILIFSIGVLGIVGMQASAVNVTRDAKYRTDAGLLANELLGLMWAGSTAGAVLRTNFEGDGNASGGPVTDGAAFTAWQAKVDSVLPGVGGALPSVVVGRSSVCDFSNLADSQLGVAETSLQPATSTRVCITVRWMAPNEAVAHSYRVVVDII